MSSWKAAKNDRLRRNNWEYKTLGENARWKYSLFHTLFLIPDVTQKYNQIGTRLVKVVAKQLQYLSQVPNQSSCSNRVLCQLTGYAKQTTCVNLQSIKTT